MLICPRCGVINYLDPYSFWNFRGTTKCAGCDTVFFIEKKNGQLANGPTETTGTADRLPGFAETPDFKGISGPGKTAPGPRARADFFGRPKAVSRNIRGNLISCAPLTKEDLVGSRPRFIIEGKDLEATRG